MFLKLPWPPSTNNLFATVRGKRVLSKRGRAYRANVYAEVMSQHGIVKPLDGDIAITLEYHPPDTRRRDLDNLLKAPLDALDKANLFHDDSQIKTIYARMAEESMDGYCTVYIEPA